MTLVGTTSMDRCSFKTSEWLSASQMLRQGRSCIVPLKIFHMAWCLRKTLTLKFQTQAVGNHLSHRNDCRQRGVIWVTYRCYNSNPYLVRNISHQEVKCSTTWMSWAIIKQIEAGDSCEVKGCNSMKFRGHRTQPLLMMAIQITYKKERGTDILSLHGSHWC